jgi:hypothetical protein
VLGILRQRLVLFEELGRIATRAAVDPVQLIAVAALRTVTAPTATVIAIVIQGNCSLISGLAQNNCLHARPTDPLSLRRTGGLANACCALRADVAEGVP